MIPKKIHYCWFGGNDLPESVKKCIDSWHKMCPDYEIVCWNEENYDINKNIYVRQAYKSKKWAFVSDYARLDILYNKGGIYLDTDVELIKSLTPLLKNKVYMGIEKVEIKNEGVYWISTGLGFGAERGSKVILDLMKLYEDRLFINEKNNLDLTPTPIIITNYLKTKGFKDKNIVQKIDELMIYPTEYFAAKDYLTNKLAVTDNTYSIHHYDNSWGSNSQPFFNKIKSKVRNLLYGRK